MRCFVYIIQSRKSGSYYIGSGCNPLRRLEEHNKGRVRSTRNKGLWEQKFVQPYSTIKEARQVEYKLKRLKRHDYLAKIIEEGEIRLK